MERDLQVDAQRLLVRNVDPREVKKQEKRALKIAAADSYEAVAREWFVKFSVRWARSHSSKVLLRLENDLFPWTRRKP